MKLVLWRIAYKPYMLAIKLVYALDEPYKDLRKGWKRQFEERNDNLKRKSLHLPRSVQSSYFIKIDFHEIPTTPTVSSCLNHPHYKCPTHSTALEKWSSVGQDNYQS